MFSVTHFQNFANSDYQLRYLWLSVRLLASNLSASTPQILVKFCIGVSYQNLLENFKFLENRTQISGSLGEYASTFVVTSR
jgi:hypothetical protein